MNQLQSLIKTHNHSPVCEVGSQFSGLEEVNQLYKESQKIS
jgi:hypothetical protein